MDTGFIEVGQLHEYTRMGMDESRGTRWQVVFIESIQEIGGQVFLGLRDVFNVTLDDNHIPTHWELGNVTYYENLLLFSRIQKVGTAKRRDDDLRKRNDQLLREQEAAKEQLNKHESIDTNGQ